MPETSAVPRNASALDPQELPWAPLPAVVMGDAAPARPRRHGWPGRLFYAFSYCMAAGLAVVSVVAAVLGTSVAEAAIAVGAGLWSVVQWRLAGAVRRFTRFGWYGATAGLGAAAAAKLWFIAQGGSAGFAGFAFALVLLRYFWKRRADFDIDLGG